MCDLSRKIFNSFDLNGDGNLDMIETKLWLESFGSEMNTLDTNFNSKMFNEWFLKMDEDGSGTMSLGEMISAICDFYKITMPD